MSHEYLGNHIPILCCCEPGMVLGSAPRGIPYLAEREWEDRHGNTGVAYASGDGAVRWEHVPGFVAANDTASAGSKGNDKKTWKRK